MRNEELYAHLDEQNMVTLSNESDTPSKEGELPTLREVEELTNLLQKFVDTESGFEIPRAFRTAEERDAFRGRLIAALNKSSEALIEIMNEKIFDAIEALQQQSKSLTPEQKQYADTLVKLVDLLRDRLGNAWPMVNEIYQKTINDKTPLPSRSTLQQDESTKNRNNSGILSRFKRKPAQAAANLSFVGMTGIAALPMANIDVAARASMSPENYLPLCDVDVNAEAFQNVEQLLSLILQTVVDIESYYAYYCKGNLEGETLTQGSDQSEVENESILELLSEEEQEAFRIMNEGEFHVVNQSSQSVVIQTDSFRRTHDFDENLPPEEQISYDPMLADEMLNKRNKAFEIATYINANATELGINQEVTMDDFLNDPDRFLDLLEGRTAELPMLSTIDGVDSDETLTGAISFRDYWNQSFIDVQLGKNHTGAEIEGLIKNDINPQSFIFLTKSGRVLRTSYDPHRNKGEVFEDYFFNPDPNGAQVHAEDFNETNSVFQQFLKHLNIRPSDPQYSVPIFQGWLSVEGKGRENPVAKTS